MKTVASTREVERFARNAYCAEFFGWVNQTGAIVVGERRVVLPCVERRGEESYWATLDVLHACRQGVGFAEQPSARATHLLPIEGLDEDAIARSLSAGGVKTYNRDGSRSLTLRNLLVCKPFRAPNHFGGRPPLAEMAALIMDFRGLGNLRFEGLRRLGGRWAGTTAQLEWTGARTFTRAEHAALEAFSAV
jgi:hypothetical protein